MATSLTSTGITFPDATTQTTAAVAGAPKTVVKQFLVSKSYTVPSGCTGIYVVVCGSTGIQGSSNGYGQGGCGGAGYAEKYIASPSGTYAITVGVGQTTSQGGTTSFGSVVSVTGGYGRASQVTAGGAGGVATGGDFNANGGNGGNGSASNYSGGGGGGGSGSRAGAGYNGGNGAGGNYVAGGGGGGTASAGTNASGNTPGTGGSAATIVNASALNIPSYTGAGKSNTFQAGRNGVSSAGSTEGGYGGAGAAGRIYDTVSIWAAGGPGGYGYGKGYDTTDAGGYNGFSGCVQITEVY